MLRNLKLIVIALASILIVAFVVVRGIYTRVSASTAIKERTLEMSAP